MRDVGKNINRARQYKKMTQDELAEKIYTTRQTVSNYETGKSRPDVEMLVTLADVLGTDVSDLIYGNERQIRRNSYLIKSAVCLMLSLVSLLMFLWLEPMALEVFQRGGDGRYIVFVYLLKWLACVLCGCSIGNAAAMFRIHGTNRKIAKTLRLASAAVLIGGSAFYGTAAVFGWCEGVFAALCASKLTAPAVFAVLGAFLTDTTLP